MRVSTTHLLVLLAAFVAGCEPPDQAALNQSREAGRAEGIAIGRQQARAEIDLEVEKSKKYDAGYRAGYESARPKAKSTHGVGKWFGITVILVGYVALTLFVAGVAINAFGAAPNGAGLVSLLFCAGCALAAYGGAHLLVDIHGLMRELLLTTAAKSNWVVGYELAASAVVAFLYVRLSYHWFVETDGRNSGNHLCVIGTAISSMILASLIRIGWESFPFQGYRILVVGIGASIGTFGALCLIAGQKSRAIEIETKAQQEAARRMADEFQRKVNEFVANETQERAASSSSRSAKSGRSKYSI